MLLIHRWDALEGCRFLAVHVWKHRNDDDNDNYDDQREDHIKAGNYTRTHT